ncbi:MAG: cupin domain-containing protein [Pseudodesulfovibrio sp.]|uniref:cupin domain-containing protein n=1 Tax=Pseudodesulfovibrio sp. TaxID=2035812 RepID=UPI003D0C7C5F
MNHQDVLSEVFSTLRLNGSLYFRARLRGDFAVEVPRERRSIRFHLVRRGQCLVRVPDEPPVTLEAGDMIVIPDGAPQVLSSRPGLSPVPLPELLAAHPVENGRLECGSEGAETALVCGYCVFDEAVDHPVLTSLPPSIVIRPRDVPDEPWTGAALDLISREAEFEGPGMTGILARMLEIVFIQAVRRLSGQDGHAEGFMAALRDAALSRALGAIHDRPAHAWTVEGLARKAGMSRARFADRFTEQIGVPPIAYLTRWRLAKARDLLARTNLGLEEVAGRCGYASGASFSRRFKLEYGQGPGAYRKGRP